MPHETQEILAKHSTFSVGRQLQRPYFRQLDTRVKPRTVGAEQNFVRPRALYGVDEQVEASHA